MSLGAGAAAVVIALASAAASAPPVETWDVDGGVVLTASSPSSNVETTLLVWPALRVGKWFALGGGDVVAGGDVTGLVSLSRDGTSQVSATRALLAVEPRFLISPARVTTTFSSLVPYGYAGVVVGGGLVDIAAFKDSRVDPIATWGASVGIGARAGIHSVSTSLELGAGLRDLRFEISSSLMLGYSF